MKQFFTKRNIYIGLFAILYLIVAFSSFWHAIEFFALTNHSWMSIILAFAFEVGQAAVLLAILTSAKDILEELHIEEKNRVSKITSQENLLEKDFSLVYIELGLQPINISELIEKTGIEYERLSEILLQLQLDGMVEQPMENYYARVVV